MKLSEEDIFKLEALWQGTLGSAEQVALEKRFQEEPGFLKAAEEWKLIVTEGFLPPLEEQKEMAEIKARMMGYAATSDATTLSEANKVEKPQRSFLIRHRYAGLAAAAAILLLLWLSPLNQMIWPKRPAADFFAHLPRDNANLSDAGDTGQKAYDRQDYGKAYTLLLAEIAAGGDSLDIIYAGVAAIGSGQADKAIPLLQPLLTSNTWGLYHAEIRWYLALAFFDQGKRDEASELLREIITSNGTYSAQAKALLEQIGGK